jgi:hypothetical protein
MGLEPRMLVLSVSVRVSGPPSQRLSRRTADHRTRVIERLYERGARGVSLSLLRA